MKALLETLSEKEQRAVLELEKRLNAKKYSWTPDQCRSYARGWLHWDDLSRETKTQIIETILSDSGMTEEVPHP